MPSRSRILHGGSVPCAVAVGVVAVGCVVALAVTVAVGCAVEESVDDDAFAE